MENVTKFFEAMLSLFKSTNSALLIVVTLSAFVLIFISCLLACAISQSARALKKKPFIWVVNLFTAIILAVFLCKFEVGESVAVASLFWCIGALCYGALCLFKEKKKQAKREEYVNETPTEVRRAPVAEERTLPSVPSGVRLDHASSIADKLLLKNLGRGDRQECEKIKTTLNVLKVKGTLTPQEGDNLNEMFNSLLKLMAKYDI